ncbi:fibronectin type III domain-containing protein [Winogradskyella sp.]|uniref:fibronectin type III domain-containing protein n=1 Tax=Winogradskyella sp. TaxID=1883156 RepID=UPI000C5465A5|nr:hypothetical protein [Aequorivita sp.]
MTKVLSYLSLSILLVLYSGCNKDEAPNNPDPVNNVPSNFEVSLTDITTNSAIVNWTVPTTDEPTTIVYSIYLNESVLVENLTETSYNVGDLSYATNYTIKVEAKNEYGISTSSINFTTLEPSSLRLISYRQNILNYNESGLLTYRGDPSPYGYINIDYTYNQNNQILKEESYYRDAFGKTGRLDYIYTNDILTGLSIYERVEDVTNDLQFQFDSEIAYTYVSTTRVDYNEYINYYQVQLEINNDNNITKYTRTNTETMHVDVVHFEYSNGNLTKITNGTNILEISYDTANNWHTYRSGFLPEIYDHNEKDMAGFICYPNFLGYWLKFMPEFYDFINTNNPLEYKYNGEVLTTFQYEYNEMNYPKKITIPERNLIIDLEYEAKE